MLESKFPNYYNKTICLIETLKSSNNSTEEVKGNLTGLFVITVKPCCTVFKDILSRLLKKDLKKSMYLHEEHFFSPYSNRAGGHSILHQGSKINSKISVGKYKNV